MADTGPAGGGFAGTTVLSVCAAGVFTVETEADGSPWGFWSVITSSLRIAKKGIALRKGRNILLEALVIDEINAALHTLCQKDVSRCRDSDDMGMFVEGFERDRIVIFSRGFACIMKSDQVNWCEGFVCNRMSVVVLPAS